MLDKTIDSVLLNRRRQIVWGNLDRLDHVEASLVLRGVASLPVSEAMQTDAGKRNGTARQLIGALGHSPKAPSEVDAALAKYQTAHQRETVLPQD